MTNPNMHVLNDDYLKELPSDQLESLITFLSKDVSMGMEVCQLLVTMRGIKKNSRPGVVIETDCGEEHYITTNQKVSKIRLNGTVIYEVRGLTSKVIEK